MGKWSKLKEVFPKFTLELSYQEKVDNAKRLFLKLDPGSLAEGFKELKLKKRDLKAKLFENEVNLEAVSQLILDWLQSQNISRFSITSGGTIFESPSPYPAVEDYDKFLKWLKRKHPHEKLTLPWQSLRRLVKELLEEGDKEPPGVKVFYKNELRLHEPEEKRMAKKVEEKRVAKRESSAAVEPLPAWVTEGNAGFEGGNAEDLILPRLAICQALSPQRKKGDVNFIEDLEEGDLFNTVTQEIYDQPLRVTPVLLRKTRMKFPEEGTGVECFGRSAPGVGVEGIACQLNNGGPCKFPGFGKGFCSLLMNFPVVLHSAPTDPIVLSMRSSGITAAKNWFTQMKLRKVSGKQVPMYAQQFDIETVHRKFKKGEAFQYKISAVPDFPPEKIGLSALAAYKALKDTSFAAHAPESERASDDREAGDEDGDM